MERISVTPRPNLEQLASGHGFVTDGQGGVPYWNETAYYRFDLRQIELDLEGPTEQIQDLCYRFIERAVADEEILRRLCIPEVYWRYIADSWRQGEKELCGRLDFSYDGKSPAKLLEFNADTPTTLYEAAIFQWEWLTEARELGLIPDESDQFTELHDDLVAAMEALKVDGVLHLACNPDIEDDYGTVEYLKEVAEEAGLETCFLALKDIGVDADGRFTDLDDRIITALFKMYPWDWLMDEEFGRHMPACGTQFIEPPWKSLLSNKGVLPFLWEMFGGHPNLLPAYFDDDPRAAVLDDAYVRKPLLSRRGENIEVVKKGQSLARTDGPYGEEGFIRQALHPLPEFDGHYALVGSWLVANRAAGIGVREGRSTIISEDADFVPHVILG